MFKPFIPASIDLNKAIKNDNLMFGEYGIMFENKLRNYLNNQFTLTFSNFNLAYFSLLTSLGMESGDEVLLSPLACLESTQPLITYGLKIKWIDVNPFTGLIDINNFKKNISSTSKLIVINHYLGNVAQIDEIIKLAENYNISVINDGIESFGSKYKGYLLGDKRHNSNFIFNFSAVRNPNTITGAAIVLKDENLFQISTQVRDNGINREIFRKKNGDIDSNTDIYMKGYSGLMNEINSYIGTIQMKYVDSLLSRQSEIANMWKIIFDSFFPEVRQNFYSLEDSNFWVYGVHTTNIQLTREKISKIGFSSSQVHLNNNIYSVFKDSRHLPNVQSFMNSFIAVPTGWWIDKNLLCKNTVEKKLKGYYENNKNK
jgi:dTDP-4-amino-4,6-dideoxygalactose transaminase